MVYEKQEFSPGSILESNQMQNINNALLNLNAVIEKVDNLSIDITNLKNSIDELKVKINGNINTDQKGLETEFKEFYNKVLGEENDSLKTLLNELNYIVQSVENSNNLTSAVNQLINDSNFILENEAIQVKRNLFLAKNAEIKSQLLANEIKIKNQFLKNYIVEYGQEGMQAGAANENQTPSMSGNWNYRKYADGTVECWGIATYESYYSYGTYSIDTVNSYSGKIKLPNSLNLDPDSICYTYLAKANNGFAWPGLIETEESEDGLFIKWLLSSSASSPIDLEIHFQLIGHQRSENII